jgi:hypothetical protein
MENFYSWLSEPMSKEDVKLWYQANNIIPELSELFKDFCFSFFYLIKETYLGYENENNKESFVHMSNKDNLNHYKWCWNKTIDNFKKENIVFDFSKKDYEFFETFFIEVFYNQKNDFIREGLEDFLKQVFDSRRPVTKSDIEMFTDIYKTMERSLQL